MIKKMSFVIASAALLSACSGASDYMPAAGVSALDIHNASCVGCHSATEANGKTTFWALAPEKANAEYIKAKITNGSMMMPSFPNIKGEQLDALAEFVLANKANK
ncbi:MAG: cytochrome c551 [Thiomicrorhabdus sp.]|nr:MAG: cytochrome c551 [Thiomicrorhabdus sp.]